LKLEKVVPTDKEGAMRNSRFSEEQMVGILCEADRDPVPQVAKRHGVKTKDIAALLSKSGVNGII